MTWELSILIVLAIGLAFTLAILLEILDILKGGKNG